MYRRFGKRVLDLLLAGLMLLFLWPVILLTAVVVRWLLGSPVLFEQPRAGLKGRVFSVKKFRTMTDARADDGALLSDSERLTSTGKLLRSTSLDELPQLLNVLRGEMSLVGPRPLLVDYLPRYNSFQARRHDVVPGITGWAQVNGRNAVGWEERFALDVYYVENQSLLLDLKILSMTLAKVFLRSGVSSDTHATMEPFMGSPEASRQPTSSGKPKHA